MEYIKENQVLLYEELCANPIREDDPRLVSINRFRKNMRLVAYIAKKYFYVASTSDCIDIDDIMQQGYLGLWEACLRFDESKGFEFSTYAASLISGRIRTYIRDNTFNLKIPRSFNDIRYNIYKNNVDI